MVNQAFDLARETGNNSGNKLSVTEANSDPHKPPSDEKDRNSE